MVDTFRSLEGIAVPRGKGRRVEDGGAGRAAAARLEAAATIRECRRELGERRSSIVAEALAGGILADWRHYPDGEVYDPQSHAQYFYHRHAAPPSPAPARSPAARPRPVEHGHFHLFLRPEGMPAGVSPLLLPELAVADLRVPPQAAPLKRSARDEVGHLVAIAIDASGEPIRLFTTNRWVTGETWYRAEDVARMLDCFAVRRSEPSAVLNRWIGAVIRVFRPQIADLLRARDEAVMAWRRRRRVPVFEDTRLEIVSSVEVALDAELAAIERLAAEPPGRAARAAPRLPRMAEGWGG